MIKKMERGYSSIALFCLFLVSVMCVMYIGKFSSKACNVIFKSNCLNNTKEVIGSADNSELDIVSKSAILMEGASGNIIYEKNSNEKVNPASITKIMTLLLIYESIDSGKIKTTDVVTVSEHAASMGGSQVFLEEGEKQTVETMIKCISIASANDAAVAMSEHIAGSEKAFVVKMNEKAKELGMKNTNFENCCGLDVEGHMSSAYDVAIMSKELITNYPEIVKYTTTWMDTITHKTRKGQKEFGLTNTNKLVRVYDGITGLKTGSTSKAKYCLSATANRDGVDMIAVVMSAPEHKLRFSEAAKLLDYGFSKCKKYEHRFDSNKIKNIKVLNGVNDTVDGEVLNSFKYVYMDKDNVITYRKVVNNVEAPINKGDRIGVIEYFIDNKKIGERDIVAKKDVKKADYIDYISKIYNKLLFQ